MIILSLHEGHNASAALSINGQIIAAVNEERFRGQKNYMGFPLHSVSFCLEFAGLSPRNLDKVVMVTRHIDPLVLFINRSVGFSIDEHIRQQYEFYGRLKAGEKADQVRNQYAKSCQSFSIPEFYDFTKFGPFTTQKNDSERFYHIRRKAIGNYLNIPDSRIYLADHHTCHAAYAYGASPIRNRPGLVFTADCVGDYVSATVWKVDNEGIPTLLYKNNDQLLGYVWRYATLHLGMVPLEHEYKVMGMAPFGKFYQKAEAIFDDIGSIKDGKWLRPAYFGDYQELRQRLEGVRFDQIAAGLQAHTEKTFIKWMKYWVNRTRINTLTFSGGLSMNVKVNAALSKENWIGKFYVPPAGTDDSLPLGACYLFSQEDDSWSGGHPLTHAYLGPKADGKEVKKIQKSSIEKGYLISPADPETIAEKLVAGKTIGRCVGAMEFGPRALGNRSILARADRPEIRDTLNQQVKYRDWWMPFAPIIRATHARKLLSNNLKSDGSYMTLSYDTTSRGRKDLAAAIHPMDKTARAQILRAGTNSDLENILIAFENKSDKLGLLNTSFNLHRKPIVLGPKEAFETFENSGLDGLLLDGVFIQKRKDETGLG